MPNSDLPTAPVMGHDPVTHVPLCEHGDDAEACQLTHRTTPAEAYSLEPSPAEMGDTTTLDPGEWTPLDEIGTQIYVYGDQPVDIAIQYAEVESELRQLRREVDAAREKLAKPCGSCHPCDNYAPLQDAQKIADNNDRLRELLAEIGQMTAPLSATHDFPSADDALNAVHAKVRDALRTGVTRPNPSAGGAS